MLLAADRTQLKELSVLYMFCSCLVNAVKIFVVRKTFLMSTDGKDDLEVLGSEEGGECVFDNSF